MLAKYTKRNTSIELLRLWLMVMIMVIHAYGHGSGLDSDYLYSLGADWSMVHHLGLYSLGQCGVTGFIFISGYYGISLRWSKVGGMVAMLAFYMAVLILVIGAYSATAILSLLGCWNNYWFVSSYLVLCLMSPVINKGLECLDKRQLGLLVLALLYYEYVGNFIWKANSQDAVFLLTIFLSARFTRLYIIPSLNSGNWEKSRTWLLGISLLSGMALFILPIGFSMLGFVKLNSWFISNNNILLLIFSASLVMALDSVRFTNRFVNYLAASALAIYILTDNGFVRVRLDPWLLREMLSGIAGYGYILLIALCCLLIDRVRALFFDLVKVTISKIQVNPKHET